MYAVRTFKADTQPEQCCTTLFSNIHKQYPAQGLGLPHMVYSQNSGLVGLDGLAYGKIPLLLPGSMKLKVFHFGAFLEGLLTRVNSCAWDSTIYVTT